MNKRAQKENDSSSFYDSLMTGDESRGLLGKQSRFDGIKIFNSYSTRRYFTPVVRDVVRPGARLLDIGCGPGGFTMASASGAGDCVGLDISWEFARTATENLKTLGCSNVEYIQGSAYELPFADRSFDVVMMVDTLHHFDKPETGLNEAERVLKDDGRLIIFEPNKLNPALYLLHWWDRNERGLLELGCRRKYRKLLEKRFRIDRLEYNGLLVGPDSRLSLLIADFLRHPLVSPVLGWLSPKHVIVAGKRGQGA